MDIMIDYVGKNDEKLIGNKAIWLRMPPANRCYKPVTRQMCFLPGTSSGSLPLRCVHVLSQDNQKQDTLGRAVFVPHLLNVARKYLQAIGVQENTI